MVNISYFLLFLFFIYGLILGSFYNVAIYRLPRDMSVLKGRSKCIKCGHILNIIDLVPILSYIFLRGKCRYCNNKISIRYCIIEITVALLFTISYVMFGFTIKTIFVCIFWSYLVIVSAIDIEHKFIIDNVNLLFFSIFLILMSYIRETYVLLNILSGFLALGIYYIIYKLSLRYYNREAFGLGDVYFIAIVSFCLGIRMLYLTIFLPFIVAAIFLIIITLCGKKAKLSDELPFAPFISIAAFIITLAGNEIIRFLLLR